LSWGLTSEYKLTKKNDLTRIEDLSELLHSEDEEDFQSLDQNTNFEESTEEQDLDQVENFDSQELEESSSFSDDNTDPEINIPEMPDSKDEEDSNFNNDFNSDFNSDFNNEFGSDFNNDSGPENSNEFGNEFDSNFTNEDSESSPTSTQDDFTNKEESQTDFSDSTPALAPTHKAQSAASEIPSQAGLKNPPAAPSPFELNSQPLKTERIQKNEDLADVKKFAQNISYGDASAEGTPPFSLIIRNVRFVEDADGIIDTLKEHGIAKDEALTKMRKSLELGSILISRVSEYSAIFLAHKLRKFNVDIMMGLADEIHPPKSYKSDDKGLVNKRNIYQNKSESHKFISGDLTADKIMLTTANSLDNFYVEKYLGIISESTQFEIDEMSTKSIHQQDKNNLQVEIDSIISQFSSNNEKKDWDTKISDIYYQMANKLKPAALKIKGNAVIGIQYQLMALPTLSSEQKQAYRLICTGNVVWLQSEK